MWREYCKNLLKKKLIASQTRNPSVSMRSFAKRLGLSSGSLSEILSGKRKISKKTASRIFSNIELSQEEELTLRNFLENKDARKPLSEDIFKLIHQWHYYAILCLFDLPKPPQTINEIAKRLNISKQKTRDAIKTLVSLQLLAKNKKSWISTGHNVTSTDEIPSGIIKKTHLQDLDLAKTKLKEIAPESRDFTATTFCCSEKQILKAKKEIRKLHQRLSSIMSTSQNNAVYKLSIQLYPLTTVDPAKRS